jgi:hypothetical protein
MQNVSFTSLDEIIGKIEVDPKIEASVVEVFQDVLDKLSDVGKKDKLLKFFKLVRDGKFPFNNIAFELFLDIVEWFDKAFQTGFHTYSALKILLKCHFHFLGQT